MLVEDEAQGKEDPVANTEAMEVDVQVTENTTVENTAMEESTTAVADAENPPAAGETTTQTKSEDLDLTNTFPVWVGDIPDKATEEEVVAFFEKEGHKIASAKMTKGRGKHAGNQFAFLNFETEEGQQHALSLNGEKFQEQAIQVSPRENVDKVNKIFLGALKNLENQEELEECLKELGDWKITKIQFKKGSNYAFVFFDTPDEANQFYDDMKGKKIKDQEINVEFPRTKEERAAVKRGASTFEIEKIKRTVYLSDLHDEVSEQQVRDFCESNECGAIVKINKPKKKKERAIMFIEFDRKTDADRFVKNWGPKETGELNGEPFLAELSRAKPSIPRRNGGRRGYGGRYKRGNHGGGWGNPYGYGGFGQGGGYGGPYGGVPYGYGAYGSYPGYANPYGYGGGAYGGYGGGRKRGRGRGQSYRPY